MFFLVDSLVRSCIYEESVTVPPPIPDPHLQKLFGEEEKRTLGVPHGHVVKLANAALVAKLVGPIPLVAREAEVRQRFQQPEDGRLGWVVWKGRLSMGYDVSASYIT